MRRRAIHPRCERLEARRLLSYGPLFAAEGFAQAEYPADAVLDGANPFTAAFDGPWSGTSGISTIAAGNLAYGTYGNAGENRVQLTGSGALIRDLLEGNNGPLGNYHDPAGDVSLSRDGKALYIALLMQVDGSAPPTSTFSLYRDGDTSADRRFRITYVPGGANFQAITGAGTTVNLKAANTTTNLFIVKIQFGSGSDVIKVWQNPTLGGVIEPTPDATISGFDLAFDRIGLTRSTGTGSAQFDELRFANSWSGATSAGALTALTGTSQLIAIEGAPPSPAGDGVFPYGFFPFIDRFGQYRYDDWADKVHSPAELLAKAAGESSDLAANPAPGDWDIYGGWEAGPHLSAAGYFRVTKYQGKWWLVDPLGRLFFSNGITGVSDPQRQGTTMTAVKTGVTGRENYFADLPLASDPTAQFLATETSTVTSGYYQGSKPQTMNFYAANAYNKYGASWQDTTQSLAHERLRSWGFNTIGAWSDANVYLQKRTPYSTVLLPSNASLINGSGTFPDYFDAGYLTNVISRINQEAGKSLNDPYNIGYFIHNELDWTKSTTTATDVGMTTLAAAGTQAAKIAFRDQLLAKYGTIAALNAQWLTSYASWGDFLTQRSVTPDASGANADLLAFETAYIEKYFSTTRQAMRQAAPNHLYLGCRFTTGVRANIARISAGYCDVVSVNMYRNTVNIPVGLEADVPIIIGEYHFSANDTGLFADGLKSVADQAARATAFQTYLNSALDNSRYVGVHWLQYWDFPSAGKLDSRNQNSNLGFVTITNTPYTAMVSAARTTGASLYERHAGGFALVADDATLLVVGNQNANAISLSISGANLLVNRDGTVRSFPLSSIGSIVVSGGLADDLLTIGSSLARPLTFNGGGEHDAIAFTAGSNTLGGDLGLTNPHLAVSIAAGAEAVFQSSQQLDSLSIAGRATLDPGAGPLYLNTLSLAETGALDLNDNDLVVSGGSADAIRDLVLAGYSSGAGIVSTSGQLAGNTVLAVFDNALVGAADWPLGSSHAIAAGAVVGKYTLFGDANLDGRVTADDYAILDANIDTVQPPGIAWPRGDVNMDLRVTADDYALLDANLGQSILAGATFSALAPSGGRKPSRIDPVWPSLEQEML